MTLTDHIKRVFPFILLAAYGLFICGYFYLDHYSDHYRLFGRFVFVLGLFVFIGSIREVRGQLLFRLMLVYMLYLLLSGLWSDPLDWYRLGQKATICLYLLGFIAITHYLVHFNRALFERLLQYCVVVAAIAAMLSIVVFYHDHPFPDARLKGLGSLTNVNEFSVLYGVFALLAMSFALRTRAHAPKPLFFLAIAVFISFAWFGQSRSALVALLVALFTLTGLTLKNRRMFYLSIGILAAGLLALVLAFPGSVEQALLRGAGLRPQIWAAVWAQASSAPLFGNGLVTPLSVVADKQTFGNAHSAYLQVFWQGGAVGLGLFLILLGTALRQAWQLGRQRQDYTLFCLWIFAACAMVTDFDTLIDRPRDQWMLFWFPLALTLAYQSAVSRGPAQ